MHSFCSKMLLNLNKLTKCQPTSSQLCPRNKLGSNSLWRPVLLGAFRDRRQSVGSTGRQMVLNPITQLLTQSFYYTLSHSHIHTYDIQQALTRNAAIPFFFFFLIAKIETSFPGKKTQKRQCWSFVQTLKTA